MSPKKDVVQTYLEGFRRTDHDLILSCLTDDVTWDMPGVFTVQGIEAFDGEIENDATKGSPTLTVDRLFEEGDTVVAVGAVQVAMRNGGVLDAVFCDVFTFKEDKICHLETYQVNLNQARLRICERGRAFRLRLCCRQLPSGWAVDSRALEPPAHGAPGVGQSGAAAAEDAGTGRAQRATAS